LNLDQIVCDILGIPRKSVPTNQVAIEQEFDKDDIEIVGETIKEVRVKGFKLPPSSGISWGLPKFFQNSLKNALTSKPHLSKEICKACNLCVEICPPKALERKDELLSIDDRKCIRCFCCQEVCPEGAITVKPGWASKFISKR
jgi:ferredoxin